MKRIKMEYLIDNKKINDGKTHDIIPTSLYAFKIDGYQFFFLEYKDLNYDKDCKTILTCMNGEFKKMELDCDESEIIEYENLIRLSCDSLPAIITRGSYLDTKEIKKHKNKKDIEKIDITPLYYDCYVLSDDTKVVDNKFASHFKEVNGDDYSIIDENEIKKLLKDNYLPKYIKDKKFIKIIVINKGLYISNKDALKYLKIKTDEEIVRVSRNKISELENKNLKPIYINN